jgi:glycosyltransferase involved in cell wall biosynthesis
MVLSTERKLKVYLTGGDGLGWALQYEMELTRQLLNSVRFTNIINSDIIHTIYWPALLEIPPVFLKGKHIVSHLTHDPHVAIKQPGFDIVTRFVNLWAVHSTKAEKQLESLGLNASLIPYVIDVKTFYPIEKIDRRLQEMGEAWGIPRDTYIIGSFQRDTEGKDLQSPKVLKGPDIFAQIVEELWRQSLKIHVLLAGPRRFWLRQRLETMGVPFTYAGQATQGEDIRINTLSRDEINILYNLIDLYLVSSRMEGGPQAVIEAAAAKCKIISSDVGHARDILHPDCIFVDPSQAVGKISSDIRQGWLHHTMDYNHQAIRKNLPEQVRPLWKEAYERLQEMPVATGEQLQGLPGFFEVFWKSIRDIWQRNNNF